MKYIKFYVLIISFALLGNLMPGIAGALYEFGDGDAIGVRVEVAKNGTDWKNFYANENPGNQTLYVSPGDILTFRGITWNASPFPQNYNVLYQGIITGFNYVENFDPFTNGAEDLDNNDIDFYYDNPVETTNNNGTMTFDVDFVDSGLVSASNETAPEMGSISVKIKNDVPDGALITGTFKIVSATGIFTLNPFINKAYAQEPGEANVRIVVQRPSVLTPLPRTGAHN